MWRCVVAAALLVLQPATSQTCANLDTLNTLINVTCPNSCSSHGVCDPDTALCVCSDGWGSASDVADYKAPDCSLRVCASGPAWGYNANTRNFTQREPVECSGKGICNRHDGRCVCAAGFAGTSCDRQACVGGCSGRGKCVSMAALALVESEPPLDEQFLYEAAAGPESWDAEMIHGCVCDSVSWTVGLGSGQYQVREFFGPRCELRRCPSGDDPQTDVDETDCEGVGGGLPGNLCYVPCANRGTCDERTGRCRCYAGYNGEACDHKGYT